MNLHAWVLPNTLCFGVNNSSDIVCKISDSYTIVYDNLLVCILIKSSIYTEKTVLSEWKVLHISHYNWFVYVKQLFPLHLLCNLRVWIEKRLFTSEQKELFASLSYFCRQPDAWTWQNCILFYLFSFCVSPIVEKLALTNVTEHDVKITTFLYAC